MPPGKSPAFISTSTPFDPKILEQVGKIAVAWAQLDFVLRAACKRIENVSWDSQQGKEIWELRTHGNVISRMRQRLNDCRLSQDSKDAIGRLLIEIGCSRSGGLYGQRNRAVHSVLWLSTDGSTLAARVGHPPIPVQVLAEEELSELAGRIFGVSKQLLELTYPTSDRTIGDFHSEADVSAAPWMKP